MTQPITTPIPLKKAIRWYSSYDASGLTPLVSAFMTQPAYSRVCVHSVSDTRNEVGGILIGQWCVDENNEQFIVIEHALPARYTRQGSVYLTFTQDSLVDIHEQIDTNYKGQKILGWYHTHPSMGVFLSHYDTWLHNHFFPEPWQVALVVEPVSSTGGFFVRQKNGLFDPTRYFGFYELDGNYGRSMVNWTNLYQFEEKEGDASK
ncbi:MAG: Mov34/MPN/PAD-1 family protein [Chloroflexi bacterium]|nr:Mov34/MPN/PAD-1 family protein [Chloroflexota bacterium]